MPDELDDMYNFVCSKFDLYFFRQGNTITVVINDIAEGFKYESDLVNLCKNNVTRLAKKLIFLGSNPGHQTAKAFFHFVDYSYEDIITEFNRIVEEVDG